MLKAIIFDLDGVLVETEPQTFKFFQDHLSQFGIHLKPEDLFKKIGRKSVDFFNDVLSPEQIKRIQIPELIDLKRLKFNEDLEKFVRKIPFADTIIPELKTQGFILAVASQNERVMIDKVLKWLGINSYFDVVLSLQDINNKKPHPEIYNKAVVTLGVKPEESIVVEDSWTGLTAAKAAGLRCIAIRHLYTPDEQITPADEVILGLEELPALLNSLSKS